MPAYVKVRKIHIQDYKDIARTRKRKRKAKGENEER